LFLNVHAQGERDKIQKRAYTSSSRLEACIRPWDDVEGEE
jgi:hypothetical protein